MLEPLSMSQLKKIASHLELQTFRDKDSIIVQGEAGESFYIIFNGECSVHAEGTTGAVATLSKGQYFGERALLTSEPRAATVRAKVRAVTSCPLLLPPRALHVPYRNAVGSRARLKCCP